MTLDEIKTAVDAGKTVHWSNNGYRVVKTGDQYLIKHTTGNAIGLTWLDGVTLNGKESDFYLGDCAKHVALEQARQEVEKAIAVFSRLDQVARWAEIDAHNEKERANATYRRQLANDSRALLTIAFNKRQQAEEALKCLTN